jgi:hypothetical protein
MSQTYEFPPNPSPQVKTVLAYLKSISDFDLDKLSSLTTDDFTMGVFPMSMGIPDRTKAEELAVLKDTHAALNGKPMSVSRTQT